MREKVFFSGFKPNDELLSIAKKWIWSIEEQSPSSSTQKAMIVKTPTGFEGYLKVFSIVGQFEVFADGVAAENVFIKLKTKMSTELKAWKKSRDAS